MGIVSCRESSVISETCELSDLLCLYFAGCLCIFWRHETRLLVALALLYGDPRFIRQCFVVGSSLCDSVAIYLPWPSVTVRCHSLFTAFHSSRFSWAGPRVTSVRLAAWCSGNGVGRINEVTLLRARLVLGWVTCLGSTPGGGTLFQYVTSQPGQLSLSSFRGR